MKSIAILLFVALLTANASAQLLRFVQSIPGQGPVDVSVSGVGTIFTGIAFGTVTPYATVPDGTTRTFTVFPTGNPGAPLFTVTTNLLPNTATTLAAVTQNGAPTGLFFSDGGATATGNNAEVRTINLSPTINPATVLANGATFEGPVNFPTASAYTALPITNGQSSTVSFSVTTGTAIVSTSPVVLTPGQLLTLFVMGSAGNPPTGNLVPATDANAQGVIVATTGVIPVATTGILSAVPIFIPATNPCPTTSTSGVSPLQISAGLIATMVLLAIAH